ncbi:HAMP domain-containing sensor histidine kinase [Neobacillus sp. WH10]|uniref:sensor histidine kinase n=1 Tax=Neobacillus sp. WH10 TaxID=3047873 RepID=UPI0024C1543E|nr:HAMP domain-containing sensor histidine kinase [Neobacillus sp. WH10]WHY79446.1 HAMP domain-containing sensor histidine kinase [Neobacillus sp. WH10]
MSIEDARVELDSFVQKYNVALIIHDKYGKVIYFPSNVVQGFNISISSSSPPYSGTVVAGNELQSIRGEEVPVVYTIQNPIAFTNGNFIASITATLQPIDEASNAILMFTPYIVVIIVMVSVGGALLYARVIANPLLKINHTAKRMANLDFTQICEIRSLDEIGELSNSLNELSYNLQQTMSELQEANEKLQDDIQKEREIEGKRREFIATISHELKSPITAVMGQIEAMIYGIGVYKDRDKYLTRSLAIMQDMQNLVNEVMEVSRLETYDFSPKLRRVNLSNMVKNIIHHLEYFSTAKSIEMQVNLQDGLHVLADQKLLEKAVNNIVNNAIKYSPQEERVQVSLYEEQKHIALCILNTGVQIEEVELDKVFQPFYRIEKSRNRNTGGSGLGLFIVKRILEIHQVSYVLQNTNDGVLFVIKFPKEVSSA